jgi:hypothetical protein
MITPSANLISAKQVSPELDLNFLSGSLDPRITFARSGATATRVNSSGDIEVVAADTPRFDCNPLTNAVVGLLIEEQRQNIMVRSEEFNSSPWGPNNATVSANVATVTAPDGNLTADKLVVNTGTVAPNIWIFRSAGTYATSVFVNRGEYRYVALITTGTTPTIFDLQNKVITLTGSGTNILFQEYKNGWFRIGRRTSVGTNQFYGFQIAETGTSLGTVVGNSSDGIYLWGAQQEVGDFVTSYIPTTNAAVTRNADVATMTGTDFSDWYSATKGTFRVDANNVAVGTRPIISADDNTADESLVITTDGTTPKFIVRDGGSEVANVSAGTITANTPMFAYASYDADYFGIARPTARQVDTSGTVPTVDRLRIGANQAGNYLNGYVQKISFWP